MLKHDAIFQQEIDSCLMFSNLQESYFLKLYDITLKFLLPNFDSLMFHLLHSQLIQLLLLYIQDYKSVLSS